jgi:hypothetical protein
VPVEGKYLYRTQMFRARLVGVLDRLIRPVEQRRVGAFDAYHSLLDGAVSADEDCPIVFEGDGPRRLNERLNIGVDDRTLPDRLNVRSQRVRIFACVYTVSTWLFVVLSNRDEDGSSSSACPLLGGV